MNFLVRLFRRETNSNEFIPVIDGLRFLAIVLVVIYHADTFIKTKSESLSFSDGGASAWAKYNVLEYGHQGVQLFFVISGFIIALPWMRYYLGLSDKQPQLKKYFGRRITRLEPPYIISTILIFLMVLAVGNYTAVATTKELFGRLIAGLFYLQNLFFPHAHSPINTVTWSLEVEVQYYIMAPLIIWAICRLKDKRIRRTVAVLAIVFASGSAWFLDMQVKIGFLSILTYFQYFIAGILLCDIFLLDSEWLSKLNNKFFFACGLVLLLYICGTEHALSESLLPRMASPLVILAFYLLAFGNAWWKRIFSVDIVTLIGGMCYSIYLIHFTIIAAVGRVSIGSLAVTDNYLLYFLLQQTVMILAVLVVSGAFFLLIEKPCMKRDWPQRLLNFTRLKLTLSRQS